MINKENHISTDDITNMPCYTNPGKQFNNIGWQMFMLKDGMAVDVLFQNNEFVNTHSNTVKAIEKFYGKRFSPGTMNNEVCLIHIIQKQ